MRNTVFLVLWVITIVTSCKPNNKIIASDDFEGDSLKALWRTDKFIPGALQLQSDVVRNGKKACRLTLRPGDQIAEELGTIFERAEIRELNSLMADEDKTYLYSFSLFVPLDFPIDSTRLVIAQWKHNCQNSNCDPDNPVIAVRYESDRMFITLQTDHKRNTLYEHPEIIRGKWLDFKFIIHYTRKDEGRLNVWLNDREIINYNGKTAYIEEFGYPYPGRFYFKTGLYRDKMDNTMTIYIDDYLKEEIKE